MLELRRQQNRTNRIKLTISDRHRTLPITQIARRSILPPHPAPTRPWLTSVFIKSTISGVQSSRGVLRSSKSEKLRKCHSSKFPRGPRLVGPGSSWRPLSPSPTIFTPHPAPRTPRPTKAGLAPESGRAAVLSATSPHARPARNSCRAARYKLYDPCFGSRLYTNDTNQDQIELVSCN